jgi:tRNA threonylcarbamoyladenosine biosynthesis protein TsaE
MYNGCAAALSPGDKSDPLCCIEGDAAMPILDKHTLDFISHSPAQTQRFGACLGDLLRPGDVICLQGALGTGKTCLTQGIGQGLGIEGPITSPSFTLVNEHRPLPPAPVLYHIDLYRLDSPEEEAWAFGLGEYLNDEGVCVIEWADRIGSALPDERLWILLRHVAISKRGIVMRSEGARYHELLAQFRLNAFGV